MRFSLLLAIAGAVLARAQTLTVDGQVGHGLKLSAADLAAMPRTMITATEHRKEVKFEGVLLRSLLQQAGAPMGAQLKGPQMEDVVYFTAKDGYRVAIALAEIEPEFQENQILIADKANGAPLGDNQGPFRLIVPEDKKLARWIRMLEHIEVQGPAATTNASSNK